MSPAERLCPDERFFKRQLKIEALTLSAPALFRATSAENPQAVNRSLLMTLLTKQLLTPNLERMTAMHA